MGMGKKWKGFKKRDEDKLEGYHGDREEMEGDRDVMEGDDSGWLPYVMEDEHRRWVCN